jgi:DNA-binding GntR family transcriptional regulator
MRESPETSSLAAEAYGVVRQRLARGKVSLGQVISRRKIAAELGMSFLPVSMALLRLESEGLLESRPRAGTRVRIPSPEDVRGHYVVREALEVQAAKLFSQMATPAERADLQRLAARVDALALERSDRRQFVIQHQKLHRRIAECTRCPALSSTIDQTNVLAAMWLCVAQPSSEAPKRRHQDLLEILGHGDLDEAAEAMRAHIAFGLRHTLEVLQPYFRMRKASGKTFFRSERKQIAELHDFKIAGDVK